MKLSLKYFLILFSLCLIKFQTSGQVLKSFSKDQKEFENEIQVFFKDILIESTKQTVANFLKLLKDNSFSVEEFNTIVDMSNLMLKERFKPTPEFEMYLNSLIAYKKNSIDIDKFRQWHVVQARIVTSMKKEFKNLNNTVYALFTKNAIASSESKSWLLNSTDYSIVFDKKPMVVVNKLTDLWCRTAEDTMIIYYTEGYYDITDNKWNGAGGKITWQRVGLDTAMVYSLVRNYAFDASKSELTVDSAIFFNKYYINSPVIGQLREQALIRNQGKNAEYPKFNSYEAIYILTKLSKNVLYVGGISMEGLNILGTGKPDQKAKIIISFKGNETLKAESESFLITPEKIVSSNASVSIYYDQDSIYHPKIIFNYVIKDRKLMLTRGEEGLYRSPMFNNYHKVEMEFDQIEWKIDEALMYIKLFPGSRGSVVMTSNDFFSARNYMRIQSVLSYQPLEKIKSFAERLNRNNFSIDEFAGYMGLKPEYVEALLIHLSMEGFIIFNSNTGQIFVRDKTYLYVNADNNKTDYDMLRFESDTLSKNNAIFSLNTGNLDMFGVNAVLLSDTHKVFIRPFDKKLTLKQNRNFEFNGYVRAGRFEFFGNKFNFDYNNFKFNLSNIDSVRFYVPIENVNPEIQKKILVRIQNVIQNVSGYVYIDHPKNKSGRINYTQYPIFECTKKSYVYFDHPRILVVFMTGAGFILSLILLPLTALINLTSKT